jgi:hypothetical protein
MDSCYVLDVATLACIPVLIGNIIRAAIIFAGPITVFMLIYGGYKLARSGGDPKQLEGARNIITYAIIGLVLVFFSFFIINLISTVTGTDISFTRLEEQFPLPEPSNP